MITDLFVKILNMSITGSYVAVAVIGARLLLRRAPKIFSYILWLAVIFRLVIPFSFTSNFSILGLVRPKDQAGTAVMEFVPHDIGMLVRPAVDAGISGISRLVNASLPAAAPLASINPMQIILWAGGMIWLAGAAALLFYSMFSYLRIMARVRTATLVKDNIYDTDQIDTPFVCGFAHPKIYIPSGMSGHELTYILLHEQTHIRRRDYLIKPFAFLMLTIHWFNPLLWLSYTLMSRDMEMSCDESVINKLGHDIKQSYSGSLLSFAVSRNGLANGSPLAFGESDVKARIKNILAYRQPSTRRVTGSLFIVAAILAGCTANPKPVVPFSQPAYSGFQLDQLMKNRTMYVGNASKVGGLTGGMPQPEGLEITGIELHTTAPPYGLTINYAMYDYSGVMVDGAIRNDAFYRNTMLFFSLIDNVDYISYSLADHTGQYDGAAYSFTFSREQAEKQMREDVRQYASDEAGLRQLIDRLDFLR